MAPKNRSRSHWGKYNTEEIYTSHNEKHDEEYRPTAKAEPFERLWSEEQERTILKGAIRFSAEKRIDYASNTGDFFVFMKKLVDRNFSKDQLTVKLRKLKRKFKDNLSQGKPISSRHEKKLFRLSKRVWGAGSIVCAVVEGISSPVTPCLSITEEAMDMIGECERVKLDNRWKELEVLQLEIGIKRAQVIQENIQALLDAFPLLHVDGRGSSTMSSPYLKIIGEGMDLVAETKRPEFDSKFKTINILQLELNMKKAQLAQKHFSMILDVYTSSSLSNK